MSCLGQFGAALFSSRSPSVNGVTTVNDVHSKLNSTRVDRVICPDSLNALRRVVREAGKSGRSIAVAGGRHAMGGQQFGTGSILIDMSSLVGMLAFDCEAGTVEVEAGCQWPDLMRYLEKARGGSEEGWGIAQKQTGADNLSLGGSVSANVHGRGLCMKPLVGDVLSLVVVTSNGDVQTCSPERNPELFRLVVGGYGLIGIIYSVTLRLMRRTKLQRVVKVIEATDLETSFAERIRDGYLYGDFQYVTDEKSDDFLTNGVFSCYRPVPINTRSPGRQKGISDRIWHELVYLAHTDKSRAFKLYADYYLSTDGQIYWSDTLQLGGYLDDYHLSLDRRLGAKHPSTEMITEIYVPRDRLLAFLQSARTELCRRGASVIYGTIRLVEREDDTFLAWAREPWACVIFNLCVEHTEEGKRKAADAFRSLIDLGIQQAGSYYLTYHRWATRQQVEACYPQFAEFLRRKLEIDPEERLQSDWYRHYKALFAAASSD